MKSIAAMMLICSLALAPQARSYRIVDAESRFTVFAGKAGFLSGLAHDHTVAVRAFSGSIKVPAGGLSGASLELEIDARSLEVIDEGVSDKDRAEIQSEMESKVLETARFPKIAFKSVSISDLKAEGERSRFLLHGDLTLKGATRRIAIPVAASIDASGVRATGEVVIKQTDFGIKPYSKGLGAVRVKDELKLSFDIRARS